MIWPLAVIGAGCASPAGFAWRGLGRQVLAGGRWLAASSALARTHPDVVGGEVPAIPPAHDVGDLKVHRLMSRGARLGAIATHAALSDAALPPQDREAAGFYYGVGASGSSPDEIDEVLRAIVGDGHAASERRIGERGVKAFHPLRTFALMPNFALCHAALLEQLRGPSAAVFSRGGGTVSALIQAATAISEGDCAHAIVGGADTAIDCLTWAELCREGHPARGLVPGEGAASLVVAATAGAPLAWITGAAVVGSSPGFRALVAETGASEIYVVAAWGDAAGAGRELAGAVDSTVIDLHAAFGDALAATPALGWCVALDLIAAGHASVTVLSAGPDGQAAAVRLVAHARRAPAVLTRRARRAVITGVGAVSAFGVGLDPLLDGLAAGASAIRPITCFDASPLAARIAGQVPADRIDAAWLTAQLPVELRAGALRWAALGALRDRKVGFALTAAAEAWRHAGLDGPRRIPLSLACGLERGLIEDLAGVLREGQVDWAADARRGEPIVRHRAPVDLAARAVADLFGLGAVTVHVSACAAGALAVAHGASLVEGGEELVLCGASDSMLDPIGVGAMITLGTTSASSQLDACRPFDRRRDGLVLGEGAAMFVIEDEAHAIARGARSLARVLGWGASQDAYRPSAPNPDGAVSAIAMRRALARAGVAPAELGYVNAHGTSTPLNDVAEVRALRLALGAHADHVPVSSIKGAVGHLMAAAGALELAASLLAFERDLLPGTAGHRERDPECDLDIIGEHPRAARVDTLMSSSFGFGGQNAVVVLGRPE